MTTYTLPFPYEFPLRVSPGCGISAATGEVIGYSRYDHVGDLQKAQIVARFFGASPSIANELLTLGIAARSFLNAVIRGQEHAEEAMALEGALQSARGTLTRLQDERLRKDAGVNASVTAALEQLQASTNGGA